MTGYLLDTSSLSLLAPDRPKLIEAEAAIRQHASTIFLPTIALAEIHAGIHKLHRKNADRRAHALTDWLARLADGFGERILSFDLDAAKQAGAIADRAAAAGQHPGFADIAIAAIAVSNDLVVVTENHRHFAPLGITVVRLAAMG